MKQQLKTILSIASLLSVSPWITAKGEIPLEKSPNVILFLMDDMGFGDLSCYGALQYKTPKSGPDGKGGYSLYQLSFTTGRLQCLPRGPDDWLLPKQGKHFRRFVPQ
jgi:hypothetical protein